MTNDPKAPPYTQEDWDEVSDSPELTEADFKHARRGSEVYPGLAGSIARRRGRPKSDAPKVQVNLRIDPDVLDAYRAQGPGWQTRMNTALRAGLESAAGLAAVALGASEAEGTRVLPVLSGRKVHRKVATGLVSATKARTKRPTRHG